MDSLQNTPQVTAIYARFSSQRQRDTSIEDQVRRCREHVLRDHVGDGSPISVFTDFAVSGASLERPGFESLMRAVDDGHVGAIVTEDVSRISRDFADAAQVFRRLQFAKVPLISIADGINTGSRHAKLSFALKSLVADIYLDDLRDKTLRGLEGRALAGFATGLVPYGYRTCPEGDARGNIRGSRIDVVPQEAVVVRRVFAEHLDGRSLGAIARGLNADGIPSPRAGSKHRRFGWAAGTIRVMLYNERYAGTWRFKQREWVRVPGSGKRRPRRRPDAEVLTLERPDLRIIDAEIWRAVQARLRAIHRRYTGGRREWFAFAGRSTYVLSGLLRCDACGAPMTINGSATTYYVCGTYRAKGTCQAGFSIREAVARAAIVTFLQDLLRSQEFRATRQRLLCVEAGQSVHALAQLDARRAALADASTRLEHVVEELARAPSTRISTAVRDLEAEVASHRGAIHRLRTVRGAAPVASTAELRAWIALLGSRGTDVTRDRIRLAAWFRHGLIRVIQTETGARLQGSVSPELMLTTGTEGLPDPGHADDGVTLLLDVEVATTRGRARPASARRDNGASADH